jgi:ribosomal protein S5
MFQYFDNMDFLFFTCYSSDSNSALTLVQIVMVMRSRLIATQIMHRTATETSSAQIDLASVSDGFGLVLSQCLTCLFELAFCSA